MSSLFNKGRITFLGHLLCSDSMRKKSFFAYITVASHAVSLVLVMVENGVQRLVYYVSKSLYEAEVHYLPLEKAILTMVHAM